MKKRLIAVLCLAMAAMFAFGGCMGAASNTNNNGSSQKQTSSRRKDSSKKQSDDEGDDDDSSSSSSGGSASLKGMIDQNIEFLDLGDGFDEEYYPDKTKIKQQSGKIDVVILFEEMDDAWRAVADEYERLHSGSVVVNLDTTQNAANYQQALIYEINSGTTDWDIVQGNLAGGTLSTMAMNLSNAVEGKNAYAGANMYWKDVLTEDAYITDKSGEATATYIMNSEGLQTAWFVNKVALDAAAAKGYNNGVAKNPETWDELMSLCSYMEQAGYNNPLGIALDNASISASQFTWLLRVYGDYYYRNEYTKIMDDPNYGIDGAFLGKENPEGEKDYNRIWTRFYNLTLDETSKNYVGGMSPKFKEFVSQFGKMKKYLSLTAATTSMEDMRDAFMTQKHGKESPQIMLDYAGWGLTFANKEKADFKLDFFDYPIMESEYVDEEKTLLRDVGGNGGYLSIVMSQPTQNELNLDFLKFFMSPYGQSIYYNALKDSDVSPKGLTTVKNRYVLIPEAWDTFFKTDKISFTGLSDNNPFVGNFIRSLGHQKGTTEKCPELWTLYLTGTGSKAIDEDYFGAQWQDAMLVDWKAHCKEFSWNELCYKYPGADVTYGG